MPFSFAAPTLTVRVPQLDTFLAKMGIPLVECKQKYSHMSFEVKQRLRERVEEYAEEFGLTELTYGSFEKVNREPPLEPPLEPPFEPPLPPADCFFSNSPTQLDGFRSRVGAADVVYRYAVTTTFMPCNLIAHCIFCCAASTPC